MKNQILCKRCGKEIIGRYPVKPVYCDQCAVEVIDKFLEENNSKCLNQKHTEHQNNDGLLEEYL